MYDVRPNLLIGFHGCDLKIRDQLINNPNEIFKSEKPYDWLGHGMYFWENNYDRAFEWALDKQKRGEIEKPAVVGAVLSLGYCFDLLDSGFIKMMSVYYNLMVKEYETLGKPLPKNKDKKSDEHKDKIFRDLDCAVIEFMHQTVKKEIVKDIKEKGFSNFKAFDSSRGVFEEGGPAFDGAGIREKNHIQICVRNPNCILGFFLERKEIEFLPETVI